MKHTVFDKFRKSYIIANMHYRGLQNEGSTCYMNSLLQTLFMTAQFRQNLYKYRKPQAQQTRDCIPYQLQQLFLQLQLGEQSTASTRPLIKSFQWTEADAFQQHDVQEFCRVLFGAIEESGQGEGDEEWIKRMYEGTLCSFVKCENGHLSERMETFMDLSLPIKNVFQGVEYSEVEEAIKGYLKTQKLDANNKYLCEFCGDKVEAEKGQKFVKLPPILCLQLKRFELNYQTMLREKINKFMYFPELLEMGRFMKPYNEIKTKGMPQGLHNKAVATAEPKETSNNAKKIDFKEKTTRPRKKSQDKERLKDQAVTSVTFVDELGMNKKQQTGTAGLTQDERKLRNIELMKSMKIGKGDMDAKFKKLQKQSKLKTKDEIEDDYLFGVGAAIISQATNWQVNGPVRKAQIKYQHEQQSYDPKKQYPQNTYALYAILVHRGSAHAGHYFAYINDGENWYEFNDSKVYKVSKPEIRRYGDGLLRDDANAYMLFYRDVKTVRPGPISVEVAPDLLEQFFIEQENQKIEKEKQNKHEQYKKAELKQLEAVIKIKVYENNVSFKLINDLNRDKDLFRDLVRKVRVMFQILDTTDQNWRLRRYNPYEDSMQEGFENTEENLKKRLIDIGFKDQVSLIIERKEPNEVFEVYDPRKIKIKVNVWREGLTILSESFLKPIKVTIIDDALFKDLVTKIEEATGLVNPLILRRTFASGKNNSYEIDSKPQNLEKNLLKMRYFNSLNLFVEPHKQPGSKPLWEQEFDSQKHRFLVRFNNPHLEDSETNRLEFYFDNRKPFSELKQKMGTVINLPINEFRVKWNNKTFPEITELRKRCIDLRFVHTQDFYIEIGRSTKGLVVIFRGLVVDHPDGLQFIKQVQDDFEMDKSSTVADLKVQIHSKYPTIPADKMRIRQLKTGRFGEIFKDQMLVQRIIKSTLIWQQVQQISRGISLYVKRYNPTTHQLSKMQQLFVQFDANYQQLSLILSDEFSIPANQIYAYYASSNMFEPDDLIDAQWSNVNSYEGKISESPLFITTDGYFLIVKNGNAVNHTVKRQVLSGGGGFVFSGPVDRTEKSLKITVKRQVVGGIFRKQEERKEKEEGKGKLEERKEKEEGKGKLEEKEAEEEGGKAEIKGETVHEGKTEEKVAETKQQPTSIPSEVPPTQAQPTIPPNDK